MEDKRTINIKEELKRLDSEEYRDLTNMYTALSLSVDEKKELANLLVNESVEKVHHYLATAFNKTMNEQLKRR